MKKVFLYANGDAANHGCEALSRTMVELLHEYSPAIYSNNVELDEKYSLNEIARIKPLKSPLRKDCLSYWWYSLKMHLKPTDKLYYNYLYRDFYKSISPGDVYISIGGDNYCYGHSIWLYLLNREINVRKATSYLIGCSINDECIDEALLEDLRRYRLITCRETLTYDALAAKGLENIKLIPDSAFVLKRKDLPLPANFIEGNTVGINLSPMVMGYAVQSDIVMKNYKELVQFILNDTDMNVAFIPHVVWDKNNDLLPLTELYELFKDTNRVVLINDCSAEELKGYIARCRFMVASRTHASIAAYSQKVPTLVLGYSVKAKGIAKDIFGTSDGYVVSTQELKEPDTLLNAFKFIYSNEDTIREKYNGFIDEYISRVYELRKIIEM